MDERVRELENELKEKTIDLDALNRELDASRKRMETSEREMEERLSRERSIRERLEGELTAKEAEIDQERRRASNLEAVLGKCANKESEQIERMKQEWETEKNSLLSNKELEIKELIDQLERRFEEDYARFIKTHKEAMQNALSQKNHEHEREKEKLMEIYQEKFGQYESEHQTCVKQIKELREQHRGEINEMKERYERELSEVREHHEREMRETRETVGIHKLAAEKKDVESVEQSYRNQLDAMETKFEAHLKDMQTKFDSDLLRFAFLFLFVN